MNKELTIERSKEIMFEFGVGASATSILGVNIGKIKEYPDFPYDYGDFMRCVGVVGAFGIDINIMKGFNPIWDEIVEQWGVLLELGLNKDYKEITTRLDNIIDNNSWNYE